jgi:hypothetical protein
MGSEFPLLGVVETSSPSNLFTMFILYRKGKEREWWRISLKMTIDE